jgi:hypothetical protein
VEAHGGQRLRPGLDLGAGEELAADALPATVAANRHPLDEELAVAHEQAAGADQLAGLEDPELERRAVEAVEFSLPADALLLAEDGLAQPQRQRELARSGEAPGRRPVNFASHRRTS